MNSTPDASGFVVLNSLAQNFEILTSNAADVGTYSVTLTATIPLQLSTNPGVNINTMRTLLI